MIMKGKYHNNGDIFGDTFHLLLPPSVYTEQTKECPASFPPIESIVTKRREAKVHCIRALSPSLLVSAAG